MIHFAGLFSRAFLCEKCILAFCSFVRTQHNEEMQFQSIAMLTEMKKVFVFGVRRSAFQLEDFDSSVWSVKFFSKLLRVHFSEQPNFFLWNVRMELLSFNLKVTVLFDSIYQPSEAFATFFPQQFIKYSLIRSFNSQPTFGANEAHTYLAGMAHVALRSEICKKIVKYALNWLQHMSINLSN